MNIRAQQALAIVRTQRSIGIARPRRRIPKQVWPRMIQREYAAYIISVLNNLRRSLEPLFAELPTMLPTVRRDAGEGDRVRQRVNEALANTNIPELDDAARRFAGRTSTHQKQQFGKQVHAALGVDLLLSDTGIGALIEGFVGANVSLIRGLTQEVAMGIEKSVMRAFQDGTLHRNLAIELNHRFALGEDRAKLIARDQVGKLYSQVNRARQEDLGLTSFIWQTVRDNRVRPEHKARHGKTYEYKHPPGGELPGEPINCRCYPEPDFSDLLGDL
jgi:SPP1 gp7 family putative phage head morphogenesis protein